MTLNSTSSTQVDTLEFLAVKSSHRSLPTQTQTQMNQQQQQHISAPLDHVDNTSFIIGTSQENRSVVAYMVSPPPITTHNSSPLATNVQMKTGIMEDNMIRDNDMDINNSTIGNNNDSDSAHDAHSSLTFVEANKKKSGRSRFNVLNTSKLRSKPAGAGNRPPTSSILLPSSTPIQNSHPPLQSRLSTSSSSTLIKPSLQRSHERHNVKINSAQPCLKNDQLHDKPICNKETNSPHCITPQTKEKNDIHSSSTQFVTHGSAISSDMDRIEATSFDSSTVNGVGGLSSLPSSTHIADPSTPTPSRFLAAFQKIRQQTSTLDHSISSTARSSLDVSPVAPTASTIATGSKSTSITEKIKSKFKPNVGPLSRPFTLPATASTTRKSTSRPVSATPRPSQSSASIINRSWSQFSRPFSSSTSLKHASLQHPQRAKQQQHEVMEKQIASMNGKRTPLSGRQHRGGRSQSLSQQQQQRAGQHPAVSSTQTPGLKGFRQSTTPPRIVTPLDHQHHHNGASTFDWDNSFDSTTYSLREDMMMLASTCSTSSQRSSTSSLSVTASSSTSASSSPISLSTDIPYDSRKPLDLNTNKAYAMAITFPQSHRLPITDATKPTARSSSVPIVLDIATAQATDIPSTAIHSSRMSSYNKMPTSTSFRSPHLVFRSISNGGDTSVNKQATPSTKQNRHLHHQRLSGSKTKGKRHVRFVPTAKVQDTFSKHDYDRASDPYAICTRLTAHLAQQIKDELNAFKLEEMLVHHQSRGNTQFFM